MERQPVGKVRPSGHLPPLLSVALVGLLVGLFFGLGFGYRLGTGGPTASPGLDPSVAPDLQSDGVSGRLEQAVRAAAPGGWALCDVGQSVSCRKLKVMTNDPRLPPSEYGLGWYANVDLTAVSMSSSHLVLAATLGEGDAEAWLDRIDADSHFVETLDLVPVNPGRLETFYFDLGSPTPGHYVIEADYLAVPPSESSLVDYFLVGFVVS